MASKYNGFLIFVNNYKKKEIENGKKPPHFKALINIVTPMWNELTAEEKNNYKKIAVELNSNEKKKKDAQQPKQIIDMHKNSSNFYEMQRFITKLFRSISNKNELLNKNFILVHINSHTHYGEHYYFPAEIAALEFNLKDGAKHTYHQIIGLSKIYPRGYAGGMREYSDKFHRISCWEPHPDDYEKILSEFVKFIEKVKDAEDTCEDLPYIYTIETEIGHNMMQTKQSLDQLYRTVYPENPEAVKNTKPIFNIGSLERLFNELMNKMEIERPITSSKTAHDILESDMYGSGLGCMYHEVRDIAFKCSKARVLQWMSNMCLFIHKYSGLHIRPGKHMAIQLKNGSKMMIENEDVPLSKFNLKYEISQSTTTQKPNNHLS
ncbi:High mobility group box domain,Maelstrom domain,Protamine-like [Cinara cedri]|uniref:High mobility group box domain,Maelstrom domain,Protamine-like n=1 Tax=Cinara cedri TaxID=506608 RepID=A0A5E4NQX4_9HEMI|nr:High mobility group box domain,Maelstrom domain,Protamine-like [Cinara cedri]